MIPHVVAIFIVSLPRIAGFGLLLPNRHMLSRRRMYYKFRCISSLLLLILYCALVAVLVLFYRGNYLFPVSKDDEIYIMSSENKWFIVNLTVVLAIGMGIDLYFTAEVKAYYLILMPKPPKVMTPEELKK
jgi:hypothetical protein